MTTLWAVEVVEVRHVRCRYVVEADSEAEAREKAEGGVTEEEDSRDAYEVAERHVKALKRKGKAR